MMLKMCNNKDDAEDLTIEAFGRAFKNFDNDGNRKVNAEELLWGLKDY